MNENDVPNSTDPPEDVIVCPDCGAQGFDTNDELTNHSNTECLVACPFCQRADLRGLNSLRRHMTRDCAEAVLSVPTDAAGEVALDAAEANQPAVRLPRMVDPASFRVTNPPPPPLPESVRDQNSPVFNVTHAWYAYVPTVDEKGIATTGLPDEILGTSPSWQTHQVQRQIEQDKTLLTPVERYGMKVRSSPYVHIKAPDPDVWQMIADQWAAILPMEIAVEQDLLEQAELDLERAITRDDRALARQRIRIFSTRVHQLAHIDFDAVYRFLVREHELSRALARSDAQVLDERIDDRIAERMGFNE